MKKLAEMSCREYAETMHPEWGEFHVREGEVIYLHASSRLRLVHERHSQPGFGFDRMEAIDESYDKHGKSCADRDAEEFAEDFIEYFCNYLSIHQLNVLIPALIAHHDELEARRQQAIAMSKGRFGDEEQNEGNGV